MARSKEQLRKVRERAEAQAVAAQEAHRRQMLRTRIELANKGVSAFKANRMGEATQYFDMYLRILEDWKGVGQDQLSPRLFDPKRDVAELLLISGIYWDMAKLLDRNRVKKKGADYHSYLQKFILFSKGTSYQPLCAEMTRRYLLTSKPVHRSAFKDVYKALANDKCFVATALADVSDWETLPRLRQFRDERLVPHTLGRFVIAGYYAIGPWLARATETLPLSTRELLGRSLSRFAKYLANR